MPQPVIDSAAHRSRDAAPGITHALERTGAGRRSMPHPSGSGSPGSPSCDPSSPSTPAIAQPGRPTHSVVVRQAERLTSTGSTATPWRLASLTSTSTG